MTKKTNILLSFTSHDHLNDSEPKLRVKVDGQGFPYIAIRNEKIIITKTDFPFTYNNCWVFITGEFNLLEGEEELRQLISNPELTIDKLSMKAITRIS
jgi:hypothetical protein